MSSYWESSKFICGDVVVTSGVLTVRNSLLTIGKDGVLIVRDRAQLVIDGGAVRNADIKVESGGILTLLNGGEIRLRAGGRVYVEKGATLKNLDGGLYQN